MTTLIAVSQICVSFFRNFGGPAVQVRSLEPLLWCGSGGRPRWGSAPFPENQRKATKCVTPEPSNRPGYSPRGTYLDDRRAMDPLPPFPALVGPHGQQAAAVCSRNPRRGTSSCTRCAISERYRGSAVIHLTTEPEHTSSHPAYRSAQLSEALQCQSRRGGHLYPFAILGPKDIGRANFQKKARGFPRHPEIARAASPHLMQALSA